MSRFVFKGEEYSLRMISTDAEFDHFEPLLNDFERKSQEEENVSQLSSKNHQIAMWTELSSFCARLRLFRRRILFLGFKGEKLVYTTAVQVNTTKIKDAVITQIFGMLERVHVDHRRGGLSGAMIMEYSALLQKAFPVEMSSDQFLVWGYIDRLNFKSLSRTMALGDETTGAILYAYGGHSMVMRREGHASKKSGLKQNSFDFLRYFDGTQFAPSQGIWEEWRESKKLIGGVELERENEICCCTMFRCDWVTIHDSSRRVLASSLVLISNLSLFRREQNGTIKPVYKKAAFNLDLVLELVAQAHEHCKTEYALIDLDEQTHGHIIEQLFERDAHCVAFASEVYDCGVGVGCSHLLSNDWNARFLDPRHTSSLLFLQPIPNKKKAKM